LVTFFAHGRIVFNLFDFSVVVSNCLEYSTAKWLLHKPIKTTDRNLAVPVLGIIGE